MEKTKRKPIYAISECALFIAMAVALSYVELEIMALGGSINLVMVPLFIICYRHGAKYSLISCLVFGLLKCILSEGIGYGLPSIFLDYILAYGACGVAGFFGGKRKLIEVSVLIGCAARFFIHFLSGIILYKIIEPTAVEPMGWVFNNPYLYSLVYNLVYMLPNTIIAIAVMSLLRVPLKKLDKIGSR